MKNKLIILLLGMSLILTSCGKKEAKDKEKDVNPDVAASQEDNKDKETEEPKEGDPENTEGEEVDGENTEDEEEQEPELSQEEQEAAQSREEQVNNLIKSSDYISIIKMSQTGTTGKDVQVLEDFKGSLRNIEFPEVKGIEPNKEYLVFFIDSDTGSIILTDEASGLHEIKSTTDPVLTQVREAFAFEDENNTGKDGTNNG
ncbi:MAG: hypothetical protein GXZ08_04275 [Tissierellia bacterium]|nr:hypothetical protein [Tissierellia bacterium]